MNGIRPMTEFSRFLDEEYHPLKQAVGTDLDRLAKTIQMNEERNFGTFIVSKVLMRILHMIPGFKWLYQRELDALITELNAKATLAKAKQESAKAELGASSNLILPDKKLILPS